MNLVVSGRLSAPFIEAVMRCSAANSHVVRTSGYAIFFFVSDDFACNAATAALCETHRIDYAYIDKDVSLEDFKLLALDMDSTLITIECIDELADAVGKRTEVERLTSAAMKGEVEFEVSLRNRVELLKGAPASMLQRVFSERLAISPGAPELLDRFRGAGAHIVVLSGGFTFFTEKLKQRLPIDEAYANTLEITNGVLTGALIPPVVDPNFKAYKVREIQQRIDCSSYETIVVGDGANDIPMMSQAYYSIAYHAKAKTNRAAHWSIRYGGLDVILDFIDATRDQ